MENVTWGLTYFDQLLVNELAYEEIVFDVMTQTRAFSPFAHTNHTCKHVSGRKIIFEIP